MLFDIGANRGLWSLANLHLCSGIVAVEASKVIYDQLVQNTAGRPIITVCKAVCAEKEATFYQANADTISTLNKEWLTDPKSRFHGEPYVTTTVEGITLDELINQYGVPQLIKIDVEGAEDKVIKTLSRKVENLCFEWARETDDVAQTCIEHLKMLGFTKFFLQHKDDYTFRPQTNLYTSSEYVMKELLATELKSGWGMIWCQ